MTSPEQQPPAAALVSVSRRREGRVLGGVCAGLPELWGLSTVGLRLVFVAAALCGGAGVVVYLACWLIIPTDEADRDADDPRGAVLFAGAVGGVAAIVLLAAAWRWRVDLGQPKTHRAAAGLPLWALVLASFFDCGGFVLVADAVRVHIGLARPPRSLWRSLTGTPSRRDRIAVRAVAGVALVAVATFLGISLTGRYAVRDPVGTTLGILGISGLAALLLTTPVAVGLSLRLDDDRAARAREAERRRYAAHLHDSVLQTLALIERQTADPESLARLARRQERSLRAWMAGEAGLSSATVATAVRDTVSEVEEENGLHVKLTTIGDKRLDTRGEELIAAAREALRNAATHASGARVNVFLDIGPHATEMFIRDDGPGFDFTTVPTERRGLRDSVIARMTFVDGSAVIESGPGAGTEIVLRLPHQPR